MAITDGMKGCEVADSNINDVADEGISNVAASEIDAIGCADDADSDEGTGGFEEIAVAPEVEAIGCADDSDSDAENAAGEISDAGAGEISDATRTEFLMLARTKFMMLTRTELLMLAEMVEVMTASMVFHVFQDFYRSQTRSKTFDPVRCEILVMIASHGFLPPFIP